MKYAIIRLQGHQHKVTEGQELLVDSLGGKKPNPEVLLLVNDKEVQIGTPVLKNAKVAIKVLGEEKGKKLYVKKYKAKSRYRKKIGFRSNYTRLQITKIS